MFRTKKNATRHSSRHFRPLCESLESRLNLAGSVFAFAAGPNLFIYGDNLANVLRIEGAGLGSLDITGVGTSVNGVANGVFPADGILNVIMEMGNGNDVATFVNADIDGFLRFNGSNGDDDLIFGEAGATDFFGSVQALMGAGNDEIHANGDNFTAFQSFTAVNGEGNNTTDLDPDVELFLGLTSITGGNGSDFIDFGDTLVTTGHIIVSSGNGNNDFFIDGDTTVNGSITVLGGSGSDDFNPGDTDGTVFTVNGSVTVSLGDGTNFVEFVQDDTNISGAVSMIGGSGVDTFDVDTTTFDALAISLSLGAGDNEVLLNDGAITILSSLTITTLGGADEITGFGLDVRGVTTVSTGEGTDLIQLDNSRFRSVVTVSTGGGDDRVNVENGLENDAIGTRFDNLVSIDLGLGNDILDIGIDADDFVRFVNRVIVNGSLGNDTLLPSAFNVFAFQPTLISIPN